MSMEKYAAIILGAGKGTRMNEGKSSPIPKVMFKIAGEPVIRHSVDAIKNAGIKKIVVVVGYKKEMVMDYLGDEVEYAVQEEQLGTGHAAMTAEQNLRGQADSLIIFYGDNPLYRPESIQRLIKLYEDQKPTVAMLTVVFDDPMFWAFGRIIRDKKGQVISITEQKDCTPDQLRIKESNPGFYIFRADWFWQNCCQIHNRNNQKEYYLTDMIEVAQKQGKKIVATPVFEENEALGINTLEQLKQAEEVIRRRNNGNF